MSRITTNRFIDLAGDAGVPECTRPRGSGASIYAGTRRYDDAT